MLESLLLLAFCLVVGLISAVLCVYLLVSGRLFTLDGMLLALISLTIGGVFALNVAWSAYTGELKQILESSRKKPPASEPPDKPNGEASS